MKKLIPSLILGSVLTGTLLADEIESPKSASATPVAEAQNAVAKTSTPAGWTDDLEAAQKQAAKEGKLILADFSGSDWCSWCIRLDKEVFSKKEFLEGAKDKFVLVFIDSPQDKSLLSDSAKSRNKKLVDQYGVRGFPTVLILDETGKQIAQTGYVRGGAEAYLKHLEELVEDQKVLVRLEKEIRDLEVGTEARVKKIHEVMKTMRAEEQIKHRALVEEVLAFDADGTAGMRSEYPVFTVCLPLAETARQVSTTIYEDARTAYEQTTPEARKDSNIGKEIFINAAKKHVGALKDCLKKIEAGETQVSSTELRDWLQELKRQIQIQLEMIQSAPETPPLPPTPTATEEEDFEGIFED